MTDRTTETIIRRRMHGLYLSRPCADLTALAHELLGLHSWFSRNVPFSALIRGADIRGWQTALTKTWLYRGTLHGVPFDDLPELLALHAGGSRDGYLTWLADTHGVDTVRAVAEEVLGLMEDGVCSRAEFRGLFAGRYAPQLIEHIFSPWGGIFVFLARQGKVAFKDMKSRDFDLISAEPTQYADEVLPGLLRRYFAAYGPATLADAAWFFGIGKEDAKRLPLLAPDDLPRFDLGKKTYYGGGDEDIADIPQVTLLSGFDPLLSSYTVDDRLGLPEEYKRRVVLKSGICLPTIAVNGQVAGLWNIKKNAPEVEFFTSQPRRIAAEAAERVAALISIPD